MFFTNYGVRGNAYNLIHMFPQSWNKVAVAFPLAPGVLLLTYLFIFKSDLSTPDNHVTCESLEELSSENLEKSTVTVLNWSGTHQVDVPSPFYFEPTSDEEVLSILSSCHETNQPVQPVGSALSPNGLSCQPQGMISLENLDSILDIKAISSDAGIVRVQA